MGYRTEINYILKASAPILSSGLNPNDLVTITKSGHRTFVLASPIMIADHNWVVFGMCMIQEVTVNQNKTVIKAKILTKFSDSEALLVSKLIQDAEKLK
jgi:hypothetical protein